MKKDTPRVQEAPRGYSINTLLILSFVIVALLPVTILGVNSYHSAWENAWREVQEKHQSLAENMAAPIGQYLDSRRIAISLLRVKLEMADDLGDPGKTSLLLGEGLDFLSGFRAVFLIDEDRQIISKASSYAVTDGEVGRLDLGPESYFEKQTRSGRIFISPVVVNPYTSSTTIFIGIRLKRRLPDGRRLMLLGELKLDDIEALRRSIHFGEAGHAVIVDPLGRVIAHPNPDWMQGYVKDLSELPIVQRMMAGDTGVMEFYSPFQKTTLVAGYTTVDKVGWGIMVPQPKLEITAQIAKVQRTQLLWASLGLLLALAFAFSLARWITRPLHTLAQAGQRLHDTHFQSELPKIGPPAPLEIQQLGHSLGGTVDELIASQQELAEINSTLQQRVDAATRELLESNRKLQELAQRDHLTQIANRRHFEQELATLNSRRRDDDESLCILLLDVDKFKDINDNYGHAAGDAVLIQISAILQHGLRVSDLAARYAGDEFVVLLRADLDVGRRRAQQLHDAIDRHHFQFDGETLRITVSMGLAFCPSARSCVDPDELLRQVDVAMYEAKRQGRNRIVEVELKDSM